MVHGVTGASGPNQHTTLLGTQRTVTAEKSNMSRPEYNTALPGTANANLDAVQRQVQKITVGEEHFKRMIDNALKELQGPQTTLNISFHEQTHHLLIKVIDQESGEVIREVPPEKTLELVARMMEAAGIIIDKRI